MIVHCLIGITKAILYFYLIVQAPQTSATQDGTRFSCHYNVAIDAPDVSFSTTSQRELKCGYECLYHEQCSHFDYNSITKQCHLGYSQYQQKSVTSENSKFCTTAMSAVVPGPGEVTVITCGSDPRPTISCDNGYITIVYANWGRTKPDSEVCEYHSDQVDDTNCYQPAYQPSLAAACDGQPSCQIVNNNGDPCSGTYKYYNVTYVCET